MALSAIDKALLDIAREREREEIKLAKELQRLRDKEDIKLHGIYQQPRRSR